jgi:hypothetical protein
MTKDSTAQLHPVAFGCRRTCGNKKRLHSHLGEAFAGDVAINKCRHMCFSQRFVWLTDCYALTFVLSYDGKNAAMLRLQMRFMCWDMIIEHRNDVCLTDADYFSRLGADLCYDPLLKEYIQQVHAFRRRSPAPTMMPIPPEHQPYFRGPRVNVPTAEPPQPIAASVSYQSAHSDVITCGSQHLANWLVIIGSLAIPTPPSHDSKCLYNSDITRAAGMLARFTWAVYGFNSGHFLTPINDGGIPFAIVVASDPYVSGRKLFRELTDCPTVLDSASALLDHVRASGITSPLTGYVIHSHGMVCPSFPVGLSDWSLFGPTMSPIPGLPALFPSFQEPSFRGLSVLSARVTVSSREEPLAFHRILSEHLLASLV